MARKLIDMLEASFEPEAYRDEYRDRVLEMIDSKSKGKRVKRPPPSRKKSTGDIKAALEASLRGGGNGKKKGTEKKSK